MYTLLCFPIVSIKSLFVPFNTRLHPTWTQSSNHLWSRNSLEPSISPDKHSDHTPHLTVVPPHLFTGPKRPPFHSRLGLRRLLLYVQVENRLKNYLSLSHTFTASSVAFCFIKMDDSSWLAERERVIVYDKSHICGVVQQEVQQEVILYWPALCVFVGLLKWDYRNCRDMPESSESMVPSRECSSHFPAHLLSTITHLETRLNSSSNPGNMTL